ncbi:RTA1 like protein-domain-containing protein [Neohortaea acidophila]|uniref:RTA1 like protein-domain-containing protein n=1 Tax=Neohortaea acidophila TaxID=245834 RepID=A0A6A6PYI0_9PEZI|nr:RTA1 like protein-domain-containing protein [Neohortaea acidophila]KAF2485180.1 RTA1 like protein-domain-containing protein [Neohortaea acidophila]
MANNTQSDDDWSLYPYDPSKAAPIAFAILLTVIACYQFYQCFVRYHWKKFGATMTWASSVWISGFIIRTISAYNVQNVGIFVAQYVLIIMGPPLYAAAEYFILGRLLAYLPYFAPIHPGRVFSTFIFLSAVVEALTANGASTVATADYGTARRARGLDILKAALILQACIEAFFFSLVATLEYRCRRAGKFPRRIRPVFYILYITSSMMLVRCIIRTIEGFEATSCPSTQVYCGYIETHEAFLWIFEIANITLFVILLALFHPGRYLPRDSKIFLDPVDLETERLGPGFGKADKRPFLVTVLDPFNFYGIITGKGMARDPFWEQEQPVYEGGDVKKAMEARRLQQESGAAAKEEVDGDKV